jgi:Flp pilus assembly protein CpaB
VNQFGKLDPTPAQRVIDALSYGLANARGLRKILAAALALAGAALLVIDAADPHETSVIVVTHDLAPGHIIAESDIELKIVPADHLPEGVARSKDEVLERTLAGAARQGEILTDVRTLSPRIASLATNDPDARIVAVRVADPAIALLLRVGDRVDVIAAADDGAPRLLAKDAAVLLVPDQEHISAGDGPVVLLALPQVTATEVARASLSGRITVTLN